MVGPPLSSLARGPQATLPRREAELQRPELHARHRGGADDRRARDVGSRERDRGPARGRRGRRGGDQARAPRIRARDRHEAVPGHARGGRRAARPAPPGRRGRPRLGPPISALLFVARQEVIFGLHVHIGMDDADKAIHVANGMRVHVPLLLALSANSPFWRGQAPGLASTLMPIFRQFPGVGMPPAYRDWKDFDERIGAMVEAKTVEDYTYLWYDVRPHPNFGTVEVRAMDGQTRVEHTLGLAALIQAMVKELAEHYDAGEHRWIAARHGLDGELVDLPTFERVPAKALARRLYD